MPIGDPPTKPADDASDADFEKYRAEFDAYVAEKLAEIANIELHLKEDQTAVDGKHLELADQERDLADQKRTLAAEKITIENREAKVLVREAEVETGEENLKLEEKNYSAKVDKLKHEQATVKMEEKRLKELEKELKKKGKTGAGGGGGGLPSELTDIILQQKVLLEKQVQLEVDREKREKEEKEKRDKRVLIGKGIKPPIFRGDDGERPEAHLMRAQDWLEATDPTMTEAQRIQNFRLTLDHNAREWYDKADCKDTWENMRTQFSQFFSTQGKSIFNLQKRWNSFSYNDETDDIEVFLRDVQETAKQLKYSDELVCTMIKTNIPRSLAYSLYKYDKLDELVSAVRNQLAKAKPISSAGGATGTTANTSPFSAMKPSDAAYFNMEDGNGQKQKPFKPNVTPQGRGKRRGKGGRGGRGRGQGFQQRNDNRQNGQGKGQSFRGGWQPRGRGGKGGRGRFDKSPNIRKPRVASKTPNQDRCYNCNEPGHFFRECPLTRGGNGQPQQKAFPGYNVAQPQVYSHMAIPQMAQVPMQMGVPTAQIAEQCPRNSNDGTYERCDDADAGCDNWRQPLLHGDVRNPQRRRTSFKLLEGDDTGTITLPTQGSMPIKVPNYKSFCITHFEAEKIYECLDSDNVVSPMVFNKDFQPPGEEVRPEYQLLEEFLDKGKPMENPYEKYLFSQIEPEEENPIKVDPYYPNSKVRNTHEMSEWSVFNTKMHYVTHPKQSGNSLVFNKCEEKVEQGILGKTDGPDLLELAESEETVKLVFNDQFDEVQNFLHLSDVFKDSRDISTTYLGTDTVMLKDHFVPECSFPIYSNSHTWGQLMGGKPFDLLLDSGASKSYMSREFYKKNPQLHSLPKYKTTIKELQMGNGALASAYFIIPVVFKVVRHKFEVFTLVADIKGTTDIVFGVKNMFEVEGELSCRNSEFRFMNRAVPLFQFGKFHSKTQTEKICEANGSFCEPLDRKCNSQN